MNFDCIIPVAGKDCLLVRKGLELVLKNVSPDKIYIITKASYFIYFRNLDHKIQEKIFLINEDELLPCINFNILSNYLNKAGYNIKTTGWYFQQFLKMGFALTDYANKYYLSWDADTFPVNKIIFFSNHGSPYFTMKDEYHEPYFITIKKLLNLNKIIDESFISENMLFDVQIMKDLISRINQSDVSGSDWCEKIINALPKNKDNSFSEFETYGTYTLNYFPNVYELRHLNTFRDCGQKYSRFIKNKNLTKLSSEYEMISLEHRDNPKSPTGLIALIQKGIIMYTNKLLDFSYRICHKNKKHENTLA